MLLHHKRKLYPNKTMLNEESEMLKAQSALAESLKLQKASDHPYPAGIGLASGSGQSIEMSSIYFMTFRHGMNPFCFKGFRHSGDLKSARNRAWKHGEIMGYKNIWVMPICVDLDQEERLRLYTGETKISPPVEEGKAPPVL